MMCEICLMKADINKANAVAVKELADAAAILSNHVSGSTAAIAQIVDRISAIVKLPDPREATEPVSGGTNPEAEQAAKDAKLPPEVQAMQRLFRSMGIEAEFVNLDDIDKKLH